MNILDSLIGISSKYYEGIPLKGKTVIDYIESAHLGMIHRAEEWGLGSNFEIHINPQIADELGLGDSLELNGFDVPVIREDIIQAKEGHSNIYIYDPEYCE